MTIAPSPISSSSRGEGLHKGRDKSRPYIKPKTNDGDGMGAARGAITKNGSRIGGGRIAIRPYIGWQTGTGAGRREPVPLACVLVPFAVFR